MRIVRTTLAGWKRYKNHPTAHPPPLCLGSPGVGHDVLGRRRRRRDDTTATTPPMHARCRPLLRDLHREFGWKSRLFCRRRRAVRAVEDPPRREAAGRRLDLRAAHLLREERGLRGSGRCGPLPLRSSRTGRTSDAAAANPPRSRDRCRSLAGTVPLGLRRNRDSPVPLAADIAQRWPAARLGYWPLPPL